MIILNYLDFFAENIKRGDILQYFIFIFDLITAILLALNAGIYSLIYRENKSKTILWVDIAFFVMLAESIVLYMTDFVGNFWEYYTSNIVHEPIIRTILIIALLSSYRGIIFYAFKVPFFKLEKVFCTVAIVFLVVMHLFPISLGINLTYNTTTWIYTFYMLLISIKYCKQSDYSPEVKKRIDIFLKLFFILQIFAYIEVIFWNFTNSFILKRLYDYSQRMLALEIITYIYDITGIICGVRYLIKPHNIDSENSKEIFKKELEDFSSEFGLTPREQEVLELLVQHLTNEEICNKLYISLGTVKTHIHNIFLKSQVSRRTDLIEMVKKYCEGRNSEINF